MKITIGICTRERYTVLCDTLLSILYQTYLPEEVIIYDDTPANLRMDIRNILIYNHILKEFDEFGITWSVVFGNGNGQVPGHQYIKNNAKHDWVLRIDDDQYLESDVIENLVMSVDSDKDIVSCLIPYQFSTITYPYQGINVIDNKQYNSQWVYKVENKIESAEHLYSSFLYNRKNTLDYCMDLSVVGHREETIFTYRNYCHGSKLKVNRNCVIWHKASNTGGIRSNSKRELFEQDEVVFNRIVHSLKNWHGDRIYPIMGGIGDNYAFRKAFDDKLKCAFENVIIATAYPDCYTDTFAKIISIQEAKDVMSDKVVNEYNVYDYMAKHDWKESIIKAYEKMFGLE